MNKDVFRLVVLSLAITIGICAVGIIVLAVFEKPVPGVLETTIAAAVSGIIGLLARHPDDSKTTQNVEVVNKTPVPVVEQAEVDDTTPEAVAPPNSRAARVRRAKP